MAKIITDERFRNIFRKWCKKNPVLINQFETRLKLLEEDPFHPLLKTHPLSYSLKGLWAIRISYEQRLIFQFLDEAHQKILLVTLGSHEEVY